MRQPPTSVCEHSVITDFNKNTGEEELFSKTGDGCIIFPLIWLGEAGGGGEHKNCKQPVNSRVGSMNFLI